MGETIEEATRKFAFEFYQREQPALVEAMQQLLDAGQTEGQIRASIKRSAAFAGQPAWKTAPMQSALAYMVEQRKKGRA
jgi:hypothetical protein